MGAEFRRCLEELDVAGIRRLWLHVSPNLPQPQTDEEALVTLHMARTQAETMSVRHRAYSHAWLVERGYPSQLPDRLRARAERLYPRVVGAVGISVNFKMEELRPAGIMIRRAMSDTVEEMYADGIQDPLLVRPRMLEAGRRERRKLFG